MPLAFDPLFHLEAEARIIGFVVAGAADLQDDAGVALVSQAHDAAQLARALRHVVAAGAVARFAADARHVGVVRESGTLGKASLAPERRGVARQTLVVCGFALGLERLHGMTVRPLLPGCELGFVAALAGVGPHEGGVRRQHVSGLAAPRQQGLALSGRHRGDGRVRDLGREGREVETQGVGLVVTASADRGVVAIFHVIGRQVRAAAGMTRLAANIFEVSGPLRQLVAARLVEPDDVATHTLSVPIVTVGHQRVEGVGVAGELPGGVLGGVADPADIVARVPLRVQQHRNRLAGDLGGVHAREGGVASLGPALDAVLDPTLRIDQHDVGNPAKDTVLGLDVARRVEDDGEEVEAVFLQARTHFGAAVLHREPHQQRPLVFRHLGEVLLEEAKCVVAVRAGVQEEDENDASPAVGGQLEAVVAIQTRGREVRRDRALVQVAARARGARRQAEFLAQLGFHQPDGIVAFLGKGPDSEREEALGVDADDGERAAHAELPRDARARVVEDFELLNVF